MNGASKRVYAFGEPVNDGERRVIRWLDERLPYPYRIYHSFERRSGGQSYEWDVLVLAPHALFCLEVKDWPGRIVGNDREWLLPSGVVRRNPVPLIEKKARILKGQLVRENALLGSVWIEPLVVIADEQAELALKGRTAAQVVTLKEVVARLTNPNGEPWRGANIRTRFGDVERVLTRDFGPVVPERQVAHFQLLEQVAATELYSEWRAANRHVRGAAPVRLKLYALDPYLPAAERDEQLRLVRRDFEALDRLGPHPNIRSARDFFADEGGRYVLVLDELPGRSLEGELLAGRSLTFEQKLRMVEEVAAALAHAHAARVVHRDVRPGNIWPTLAGALLVNFDCARLDNAEGITKRIKEELDPDYLAPEVRVSPSAATAAADIYALGVVLYELLAGELPAPDPAARRPLADFDPLIEPQLEALVERMLAAEPSTRPDANEVRETLAALRDQRRAPTQPPAPPGESGEASGTEFAVDDIINGVYLVREVLGGGSFGKVYRVYSAVTKRDYAMKVFRDPGLGLDDAQREYSVLAPLQHRRIARVHHADRLREGIYYLLTDCIEGTPLDGLVRRESRPAPTEALRYATDLLEALRYLHSQGYVHRDIKPSNIIAMAEGAWLIDFNIATHSAGAGGERAGTPRYTPPDVAACGDSPSRDLFAAGVVLFELLTGVHPYGGPPRPGAEPVDPREAEPRLSEELARVLQRAVAPSAAARFASADEFLAALRTVDEPLLPPPPTYEMVKDITIAAEERARRNYNPYLTRFLTLYSQNRRDNSGTRGYDEISRATYVRTRLDKRLAGDILGGNVRLAIITGNAGDGKTAFLQHFEKERLSTAAVEVTTLPSGNGSRFQLRDRHYQVNYDGSQDEAGLQNDEVLADFFAPFAGRAEEIAVRPSVDGRLIAINEGKLRDFLARRRDMFPWLAAAVPAFLDEGKVLPEGFVLVNLNDRAVVSGEPSIVDEQIETLCNPVFWEPCLACDYRTRCPVKFNVDTFNHPDLGPRARRRLHRLFELAHWRGRLHLTMRGLRSALAFLLFGEEECPAIIARLERAGAAGEEDLLRPYFYNAIAGRTSAGPEAAGGEESDRLLRLLAEADIGLGANPADDRELYFAGARASRLLPIVGGRGDYDRELLVSLSERLAAAPDDDERAAAQRRHHAMLRRKAFFERPDDGWEAMLPYTQLALLARAGQGDEEALDALKQVVIAGINRAEGLSNVGEALVLRLARGVPGVVHSFRQFPAGEFRLRVARPPSMSDYVEFAPTALELVYRPDAGNGERPTLRIGLDLLELLARMARGYAPTATEWRAALVNLQVFRTLLAHEEYDQLLLVDTQQDRRFRMVQQGAKVKLMEEGAANGAGEG